MSEPRCIRCGGTDDLMDRAMAPGMTYCGPCRKAMSVKDESPDDSDDWLLRDALQRLGLPHAHNEAVVALVRDWLETYAVAGIADVTEPLAELELK